MTNSNPVILNGASATTFEAALNAAKTLANSGIPLADPFAERADLQALQVIADSDNFVLSHTSPKHPAAQQHSVHPALFRSLPIPASLSLSEGSSTTSATDSNQYRMAPSDGDFNGPSSAVNRDSLPPAVRDEELNTNFRISNPNFKEDLLDLQQAIGSINSFEQIISKHKQHLTSIQHKFARRSEILIAQSRTSSDLNKINFESQAIELANAIYLAIDSINNRIFWTRSDAAEQQFFSKMRNEFQNQLSNLVTNLSKSKADSLDSRIHTELMISKCKSQLLEINQQKALLWKSLQDTVNGSTIHDIKSIQRNLRDLISAEDKILYKLTEKALFHRDRGESNYYYKILLLVSRKFEGSVEADVTKLNSAGKNSIRRILGHKLSLLTKDIERRKKLLDLSHFFKQLRTVNVVQSDVPSWVPVIVPFERLHMDTSTIDPNDRSSLAAMKRTHPKRYRDSILTSGMAAVYFPHWDTRVVVPLNALNAFEESETVLYTVHGACSENSDPESFTNAVVSIASRYQKISNGKHAFVIMIDSPNHAAAGSTDKKYADHLNYLGMHRDHTLELQTLQEQHNKARRTNLIGRSAGAFAVMAGAMTFAGLYENVMSVSPMSPTPDWKGFLEDFCAAPENSDEISFRPSAYDWHMKMRPGWLPFMTTDSIKDYNVADSRLWVAFSHFDFQYPVKRRGALNAFTNAVEWPNVALEDVWDMLAMRRPGTKSIPFFADHNPADKAYPNARENFLEIMALALHDRAKADWMVQFYRDNTIDPHLRLMDLGHTLIAHNREFSSLSRNPMMVYQQLLDNGDLKAQYLVLTYMTEKSLFTDSENPSGLILDLARRAEMAGDDIVHVKALKLHIELLKNQKAPETDINSAVESALNTAIGLAAFATNPHVSDLLWDYGAKLFTEQFHMQFATAKNTELHDPNGAIELYSKMLLVNQSNVAKQFLDKQLVNLASYRGLIYKRIQKLAQKQLVVAKASSQDLNDQGFNESEQRYINLYLDLADIEQESLLSSKEAVSQRRLAAARMLTNRLKSSATRLHKAQQTKDRPMITTYKNAILALINSEEYKRLEVSGELNTADIKTNLTNVYDE